MATGPGRGWAFDPPSQPAVSIADEDLNFPIHRIYCVGQNYSEHTREMGGSGREQPCFFAKPADAITQATPLIALKSGV